MKLTFTYLLAITALIQGCGGSDSGSMAGTPSNPNYCNQSASVSSTGSLSPIIDNQVLQIFGNLQVETGGATGFAIIPKGALEVDNINWMQSAGPTLVFMASNSQTIGFDVQESGNYSLKVAVKMVGETSPTTYDIDFSAASGQNKATIRLDHTVTELGKVSLHIGIPENKVLQDVQWTQVAGPRVLNAEENEDFLFFDAPSVNQDSIVSYSANVTYSDGSTDNDDVIITVKNTDFEENGLFCGNDIIISEDLFAYQQDSPYKLALEQCVYNNKIPNPPICTFATLPMLGMETNSPTIDDVLNRTLVSHKWMGDRFADYLQNSPAGQDILLLLRGVTAVVISYDVRPSFYWSATGAIYLDANNFWQTPSERDTLNDAPDYRANFGSDLKFSVYWRYTKNNEYYPKARIDKQDRINRDFSDVEASISWLMYHELAHANDFFPASSWASINTNITPLSYSRSNTTSSDTLVNNFPLRSDEMHSLAQVRFNNSTPTNIEKNYTGTDIEGFFSPDIAASFYSYYTEREDFATLVERYMMLYRLDSEADVAIIEGTTASDEPLVVWGQRNRISDSSLEDRTVFAVNKVYPELEDVRTTLRTLPSPILMNRNQGWFENINISPSENNAVDSQSVRRKLPLRKTYTLEQMEKLAQQDSSNIHKGKPVAK